MIITAKDIVDIKIGDNEGENELEKKRMTNLIDSLSGLSKIAKERLVKELLDLVADQREQLIRRVQAATVLAYNATILGIKGSVAKANYLSNVLEREFLSESDWVFGGEGAKLRKLGEIQIMFLERLACAALGMDQAVGSETVIKIAESMKGTEIADYLQKLLQKAQKAE